MVKNVKSKTDLSGFYIVFKGSAQLETPGTYGISHLCEHLAFHHLDDLLDDFDQFGISNNAYTSDTEVVFHFTGLDEELIKFKDVILEKLLKFNVSQEMFENERQIVLKEYMNSFNSVKMSHRLNLFRKLYGIYRPIGLKEDIENITYEDFKVFYDMMYSKPHMIINVSKYNDFKTDIEFSDLKSDVNVSQNINNDFKYEKTIEYNSDNSSIINLSEIVEDDFPYVMFLSTMLGSGLKSPLYQEIREKKGLVYYIHCYLDQLTDNQGVINITTETATDNIVAFQEAVKEVLDNPDKYMTKERFNIVKKSMEIKLKKMAINRYGNVDKYIIDKDWQLEPILKDLTYDKVMSYYDKYFKFDTYYTSIDSTEFNQENV